jgi:hypothetical protein
MTTNASVLAGLLLSTLVTPAVLGAAAPADQIAAAVLAAPEDRRPGAGVLGYDAAGALVTLRAAKNDFLCLADDPKTDGFEAACYHKDLEPYMARGRALRAQGIVGEKSYEMRWSEIQKGTLAMSREPRPLYILQGKAYNPATGMVEDEYRRSVLYWPYATPESTGLSTKGYPGQPWLMFPGTAGAHVMISPARPRP